MIEPTFSQRMKELAELVMTLAASSTLEENIESAITIISGSLAKGLPVLICGNGGSAADALHVSGELVGKFLKDRKALNVTCLNANVSVITAWSNDFDYESSFSRQVEAHGKPGGVLWALSTSGNSKNILAACETASQMNMSTVALTGKGGGQLAKMVDLLIDVNSLQTPRVQELHQPIYHYICECVEARMEVMP